MTTTRSTTNERAGRRAERGGGEDENGKGEAGSDEGVKDCIITPKYHTLLL